MSGSFWIDGKGVSELHVAAYNADAECVEALFRAGGDVNQRDAVGYTPLHWACFRAQVADQTRVIRALVAAGADVNALTSDGSSHSLIFASHSGCEAAVETLVRLGAAVDLAADGVTALMVAAREGDIDLVGTLLRLGADPAIRVGRFTAADYAAHGGHEELARRLAAPRGAGPLGG
jgi:ankyrin repeat protein